jgi:hypothetical protein
MVNSHENFVVATLKVKDLFILFYFFDILCSHGDFSNFQKIVFKESTYSVIPFFLFFIRWLSYVLVTMQHLMVL